MAVTITSVIKYGNYYRVRARATAQDATINLNVIFKPDPDASNSEIWRRAKDEVLKFLDVA